MAMMRAMRVCLVDGWLGPVIMRTTGPLRKSWIVNPLFHKGLAAGIRDL